MSTLHVQHPVIGQMGFGRPWGDLWWDGGNDSYFAIGHFGSLSGKSDFGWWNGSSFQPNFRINNNGSAWLRGSLTQNSDIRHKTDIVPIRDALQRVCQLRGVNFRWNDEASSESGPQMGLIGQEVEPVFPELVQTESDGTKSIAYTEITAALVEAVKELSQEVQDLRAEVEALRQEKMPKDP